LSWAPFAQLVHGLLTQNALVTLAHDFVGGSRAIRVRLRGRAKQYSVDLGNSVVTTRPRAPYRLSGYLRTGTAGANLCLRIQELGSAARVVTSTERCFTPKSRWAKFSVRSRSLAAGHRLLVSAYEYGSEGGDSFEIGGVSFSGR